MGAKLKQAGKKEGGWGEGIFARSCLPFPFRLRKEKAEGGFGGNSAFSFRNQIVDSPAVLLVKSRTPHKSFLFLLEEKNRRAQIKNCEENFFAGWRGFRATAGLASLLGVLLKKSSNINQKTPQQNNEPSMNILGDLFYRRRGIRTEPRRSPR